MTLGSQVCRLRSSVFFRPRQQRIAFGRLPLLNKNRITIGVLHMSFNECKHIKENGTYCRSAAVRGRNYCYFHLRSRARRLAMAQAQSQGKPYQLQLPPLEDLHAVQSAVMQVVEALASGYLDAPRGRAILYGLQQAAANLKAMQGWIGPSRFAVDPEDEYRAPSYPALEADFGLPRRINIDAAPQVAFPPPIAAEAVPRKPPRSARVPHADNAANVADATTQTG
jgi:hypothetical protein